MKNFILLLTGLVLTQVMYAQRVDFGLKAGANFLYIEDQNRVDPSKISLRVDYHVGGLAHITLSKLFAIQPEVVYSKEGAAYSTNPDYRYRGNDVFNYVNIPLLFQFTPGNFRIQAGPQFGINTRADFDSDVFVGPGVEHKPDIKKTDWAIAFGFSYITHYYIGVDVRANVGVGNIYKDGYHPGQYARNRALQVGLFYQFPNRKTTQLRVAKMRKHKDEVPVIPTTNTNNN